jgi:hypothetical protein
MKKTGAVLKELQIMASSKWLQLLQRSPWRGPLPNTLLLFHCDMKITQKVKKFTMCCALKTWHGVVNCTYLCSFVP